MAESSNGGARPARPESGAAATSSRRRRTEAQGQPRMWLQPFLLVTLEHWQAHGYELMRRMTMFGFEALDRGSVYRTLRQLEEDGLVVSDWDTPTHGPARRLYSLTEAGRSYLNVWATAFRGSQSMLDEFFSLYPAPAESDEDGAGEGDAEERQPSTTEGDDTP